MSLIYKTLLDQAPSYLDAHLQITSSCYTLHWNDIFFLLVHRVWTEKGKGSFSVAASTASNSISSQTQNVRSHLFEIILDIS